MINTIYLGVLINKIENFMQSHIQTIYDKFYAPFCESDLVADIVCGMFFSVPIFWFFALLFTFLDLTKWPAFLYQYKIHNTTVIL